MKQGKKAEQFTLLHWWTSVILRMRSWNHDFKSTKVGWYSEVTLWKTIRALLQYLRSKVRLRHRWQLRKYWMSYQDYKDAQDKLQMQYQHTLKLKWKMRRLYEKIPKSECPDIWIRLPRHKWPKSWSSMIDPVVPLERNLYAHPLAGLLWERQFEKVLLEHDWEKVPNWECLFVNREKGLFLSVYVDDIKLAGKEQNIDPMCKTCWWNKLTRENQHHFLTTYTWHVHKENVERTMILLTIYKYVRIKDFRRGNGTTTHLRKPTWSDHICMVLRYGRSCQEMCGTLLWAGQ